MKKTKIFAIIVLIAAAMPVFAQLKQGNSIKLNSNKDPRNKWGLNFLYAERGFGISSGYFLKLGRETDLFFNLSVSGVTDSREFTDYDIYGNPIVRDKLNRVFLVPLSIGIQKYVFADEIEGNIKPFFTAGITPALVFTNPYEMEFFNALGHTGTNYAFGGFAGVGLEFKQTDNLTFTFNVRYYYLESISSDIISIKDSPIKNLGGINITFGVNFLK